MVPLNCYIYFLTITNLASHSEQRLVLFLSLKPYFVFCLLELACVILKYMVILIRNLL